MYPFYRPKGSTTFERIIEKVYFNLRECNPTKITRKSTAQIVTLCVCFL